MGFGSTIAAMLSSALVIAVCTLAYTRPDQYARIIEIGYKAAWIGVLVGAGFVAGVNSTLVIVSKDENALDTMLSFPWYKDLFIVIWPALAAFAISAWGSLARHVKNGRITSEQTKSKSEQEPRSPE